MRYFLVLYVLLVSPPWLVYGQEICITGNVKDRQGAIANAAIWIDDWKGGGISDSTGKWLVCGPPKDTLQVRISYIGYSPTTLKIAGMSSVTIPDIFLEKDPFLLDQIVVTGSNTGRTRGQEPQAMQVLDLDDFLNSGSSTLAEGLCYQTGLRVESNCQTCQFTQLRMNGLTGSYTQMLLDGRPVFNALLSMYGLEQFPVSLLERVEVIRGGGPVALGARAIGGTINLITARPDKNTMDGNLRSALIGGRSLDLMADASVRWVSEDKSFGNGVYIALRERQGWDANNDGFTEIPTLKASSIGWVGHWEISDKHSLDADFWALREFRRGGDQLDIPAHEAQQAEERDHHIFIASIRHRMHLGKHLQLENYAAGQYTSRTHYTGTFGSPGWGDTESANLIFGSIATLDMGDHSLIFGADHSRESTLDEIPGYGFLLDQAVFESGLYFQDVWDISRRLTVDAGIRLNFHNRLALPVLTPRINLMYLAGDYQLRAGWSRGFKGPQAFESDLHISFSGGGVSRVVIDPELTREISDGWYISADRQWNHNENYWFASFQVFANSLRDNFILENTGRDSMGNLLLRRENGQGAIVYGVSAEYSWRCEDIFQWESGWTWQRSTNRGIVQWSDAQPGTSRFLRTPDHYGYSRLDLLPESNISPSLSAVFTGPMLVPHLAGAPGVDEDELKQSPFFADIQCSVSRSWAISGNAGNITLQMGVRNVLNAFQRDLDQGPDRDSNYVYGPFLPRSFYLTVRWNSGSK